ncbi:hypothetical protein ACWGCW_10150 [Streptomyces sp. NPDC054933]
MRLLPTSDTDKDIDILTLRHQLAIPQCQIDKSRLVDCSLPPICIPSPNRGCGSFT